MRKAQLRSERKKTERDRKQRASFNREREFEIAKVSHDKRVLLNQLTKAHEENQRFKDLSMRHKEEADKANRKYNLLSEVAVQYIPDHLRGAFFAKIKTMLAAQVG